jgi:cellulose binding protein with CBM2 domain
MNDSKARRSLVVVLLDAVLRLVAVVHTGGTPTPKIRKAGERPGAGRYLLLVGVLAALAGTALLVVVLVRAPDGSTPPPDRAAALPGPPSQPSQPAPAAQSAQPGVVGSTAPSPPATATATATASSVTAPTPATTATGPAPATSVRVPATEGAQAPLTASYRTTSGTAGLLGYRMTVTVANPGPAPKDGWTLTVTLPRSTLRVTGVSGATATQDGSAWSFVPDATTSRVPADGSVEMAFEVQGATLINATPRDCRIDADQCKAV